MSKYPDSGIWSKFYLLADTAIKDDEEEQRRLLTEKQEESKCRKTLSEEEQSKKGFSFTVPRYLRSSLVNRRYPQRSRDLNGASLSVLGLNQIPQNPSSEPVVCDEELRAKKGKSKVLDLNQVPQNPSSEPTVCDEELLRAKKGKSKVVYEDDDEDEESEKRLFEKNLKNVVTRSRSYPQPSYAHLNGASTSSSFPRLRCRDTADESEKTEDPPNPSYQSSSSSSCLTENTNRKRRAVPQRETPYWVVPVIGYLNGDSHNPRLVFERTLTARDVNSGQTGLLMPFNQLLRNDFLTPEESRAIEKEVVNEEDEANIGVGTVLVNQWAEMWGMRLKIWAMEKESGNGTMNYILNWGWNDVVRVHSLKKNDKISLWAFRCRGVLCFALHIVRAA